ncbi:MAG: hypothetical protein K5989_07650 [Lachnospiraceae bacterium]|nr:hypothetical protein [Lachnospiraceae bacterium]
MKNGKCRYCLIAVICLLLFAGCSSGGTESAKATGPASASGEAQEKMTPELSQETGTVEAELPEAQSPAPEDPGAKPESGEEKPESPEKDEIEGAEMGSKDLPLYKKLCGKYSCKSSDEECYILDITEFGGNLYGFGGLAMAGEEAEYLEAYSFWAIEFLPEEADNLLYSEDDSCRVGVLNFSIMSNLGKYWGKPAPVTIRHTGNGIMIEDPKGRLFSDNEGGPLAFQRDDRVEDIFPYMEDMTAFAEDDLNGLWRQKDGETPLYLEFTGGTNLRIYRKEAGREVFLGGGSYQNIDGARIESTYSLLGSGSMPMLFHVDYRIEGSSLIIDPGSDYLDMEGIFDSEEALELERIKEGDVPVISLKDAEEAGLGEDKNYDAQITDNYGPFYGVWVAAITDRDEAESLREELKEQWADASVLYAPDWDGLGQKPYYCVTAGRCRDEEEAETLVEDVKKAGYGDAYVKYSGQRATKTVLYTVHGDAGYEYDKAGDRVLLRDVLVDDLNDGETTTMTLFIDGNTLFDESCNMESFGNYQKGHSPLQWVLYNMDLAQKDPDRYMKEGPALVGVFQATLGENNHIDGLFGSYWWD